MQDLLLTGNVYRIKGSPQEERVAHIDGDMILIKPIPQKKDHNTGGFWSRLEEYQRLIDIGERVFTRFFDYHGQTQHKDREETQNNH